MADPRRKVGVPARRHPVSGTSRPPIRTQLRELGMENGWEFKYAGGDCRFIKGHTVFHVFFAWNHISHGALFKPAGRGIYVDHDGVRQILRGEHCVCLPMTQEQWESGMDDQYDPACPIAHGQVVRS